MQVCFGPTEKMQSRRTSPMFGHIASSQTVCRLSERRESFKYSYLGPRTASADAREAS